MDLDKALQLPLVTFLALIGHQITPVQMKLITRWLQYNGAVAQLGAINSTTEHFLRLRTHICLN